MAARIENPIFAKLLIESGAKINEPDNAGNTPLHSAADDWHNLDTIKYLVLKGADLNTKNHNGKTPRDLARTEGRNFFARYKANPEKVKKETEAHLKKVFKKSYK